MFDTLSERNQQRRTRRWEYKRRLNNAIHLATMLRGITLGASFCLVMFAIAGIDTDLDAWIEFGTAVVWAGSLLLAEHIMFWAEQSRYPKHRRRTLRSELAEEWQTFREVREARKARKFTQS